jgi:hypothetical protein
VAGFGTRFKTYRKTPALQVRPEDLPLLGVYILRETREAWGAANHAEPKFMHMLTMGFSGAVHGETDEQNQLLQLEEWMSELDDILLSDPKFVKLTGGVQSMDRQSQYAKIGETTLYEIRVEMVIPFQSNFPPRVDDMLERIHVETRYPSPDTDPAAVIQIVREYDMDQNS